MSRSRSWRALLRVAAADVRSHTLQAVLIAVMVLAATGALTLALNVRRGTRDPWQRAFDASAGAQLTFYTGGETDEPVADLTRIGALDGVTATAGPYAELWDLALVFNGESHDINVQAAADDGPSRAVSRPLVSDGAWLDDGADGVVLERGLARSLGIQVGDMVQIAGVHGLLDLRVTGLVIEPWRSPYTASNTLAFVRPTTFATLQPDQQRWTATMATRVASPADVDAVAFAAGELAGRARLGIDDWRDVRDDYLSWYSAYSVFLGVFSVFALFACGLIISNLIAGRVLAQYRDIGLLKAVGFTPGQVALVYLLEHGLLAIVGATLGLLLGFALSPLLLSSVTEALNTTATASFDLRLALLVLLGVLGLTLLFTLLPALRGGRVSAMQAIQHGFSPAQARPALLARLAARLHLPTPVVFGAKDVFARRSRAALTVVALTLTVVTVVFSVGVESTVRNLLKHPELFGEPYNMTVTPGLLSAAQTEQLVVDRPEIAYYFTRVSAVGAVPSHPSEQLFSVRALGGDWQAAHFAIPEGRMFSAPGEAIAGRALLDQLGARVGDSVALTINGQPATLRIVGRYLENDDGGRMLQVSDETLRQITPLTDFNDLVIRLHDNSRAESFARDLQVASNYGVNIEVEHGGQTPPEATALRRVIFGLSSVLLVIGLINLLATSLLNVRERQREFGIAKTLGLTPAQVMASVVTGAGALALVAASIGIPLGLLTSWLMFKIVVEGQLEAPPEFYAAPNAVWLALVVAGVLLVAALASALPARHAARVRPADALRYS